MALAVQEEKTRVWDNQMKDKAGVIQIRTTGGHGITVEGKVILPRHIYDCLYDGCLGPTMKSYYEENDLEHGNLVCETIEYLEKILERGE